MYFENIPVVKLLFHILWHGEEAHRNVLTQSAFPFYLGISTWALSLRSLSWIVMKKEGNWCSHFSRKTMIFGRGLS